MIGNDIIDINLARQQSNWKRKGWLEKLFTAEEQQYIKEASNPEHMVWQLWSRKEAAYKAHQRCFELAPIYNPIAFQCTMLATVVINGIIYHTKTMTTSNYIHTIAQKEKNTYNTYNTYQVIKNNSATSALLTQIAQHHHTAVQDIQLRKDQYKIPKLYSKDELLDIPFSLSHHGRYAAYAYSTVENSSYKKGK